MEQAAAITIFKNTLFMVFIISFPMLIAGLIVGVIVSIFEAVTAIREMTLTFVPKILAVGAALFFTLPWIITKLTDFAMQIFTQMRMIVP